MVAHRAVRTTSHRAAGTYREPAGNQGSNARIAAIGFQEPQLNEQGLTMRKRKPRRHGVTVLRAKPARLPRNEWDEDDDVEIGCPDERDSADIPVHSAR